MKFKTNRSVLKRMVMSPHENGGTGTEESLTKVSTHHDGTALEFRTE